MSSKEVKFFQVAYNATSDFIGEPTNLRNFQERINEFLANTEKNVENISWETTLIDTKVEGKVHRIICMIVLS